MKFFCFSAIGSVHAECVAQQHFDGPSFVGGIVLAVGVVAIGYVMYRYFQNKRQTGMTFNDI